jgi:hypothetical protein
MYNRLPLQTVIHTLLRVYEYKYIFTSTILWSTRVRVVLARRQLLRDNTLYNYESNFFVKENNSGKMKIIIIITKETTK